MTENQDIFFLKNDEDFLPFGELSKQTGHSEAYLEKMARLGKLKAFKMGDEWLTNQAWLTEHKCFIKTELEKETDLMPASRFVSYVPGRRSLWQKAKQIFGFSPKNK